MGIGPCFCLASESSNALSAYAPSHAVIEACERCLGCQPLLCIASQSSNALSGLTPLSPALIEAL